MQNDAVNKDSFSNGSEDEELIEFFKSELFHRANEISYMSVITTVFSVGLVFLFIYKISNLHN